MLGLVPGPGAPGLWEAQAPANLALPRQRFTSKQDVIRHYNMHKKRDNSLQHGFMRFSPLDDCSVYYHGCHLNGKSTHYHCMQVPHPPPAPPPGWAAPGAGILLTRGLPFSRPRTGAAGRWTVPGTRVWAVAGGPGRGLPHGHTW